jgi:hypothetical protein
MVAIVQRVVLNAPTRATRKLIRERRNAVSHESEDDAARLAEFFALLVKETPARIGYLDRLRDHCSSAYGI